MLLILACHRSAPTGTIVLVPIGDVPADLLAHLQRELPAVLERRIVIASPIAKPESAFDAKHDDPSAERVIGVIDADAYVIPSEVEGPGCAAGAICAPPPARVPRLRSG